MLPSRLARALAVALFSSLTAALLPATSTAHAADRTVARARLDWGIK